MDTKMVNARRMGFQSFAENAPYMEPKPTSVQSGIAALDELGKKDPNIKKSMEVYGWHEGHKVFATRDLSLLKLIPNAGSMVFSGRGWRTCRRVAANDVAQVMTVPFPISPDNFEASLHVPAYDAWLHGGLMYPEQFGSDYKIGSKVLKEPPYYRVSQYLTIMDDLAAEMFHGGKESVDDIAKTLYQVQHSFRNLIHSPDYLDKLPKKPGETVEKVADELAVMLRDRDGNPEVAKQFVKKVNQLHPADFFKAMRLIATDRANLLDQNDQLVLSSDLFHHSVFVNGDLIFASLLLEGNSDSEGLTPYWIKRKVQEAFKYIPKIDLSSVTSLTEAITTIHRQAGTGVERKLRQAYFQQLVHDEILSQPTLSRECIAILLSQLLDIANRTTGITSLLIALLPDMANITDLNQSVAEMLLIAMKVEDKKKLMLPIKCFRQSIRPNKLKQLVDQNVSTLNMHREKILAKPSTGSQTHNSQKSVLENFCEQFRTLNFAREPGKGNRQTDSASKSGAVMADIQDPPATQQDRIITSGNPKLIESLYNEIARLTINRQWEELVKLIQELEGRQHRNKDRLIGAKNACRLVARLLQQQLANNKIEKQIVTSIFNRLRPMLLTIDDYLPVNAIRCIHYGRGYISKTVRALYQPRPDQAPGEACRNTEEKDSAPVDIDFIPLDQCINRQRERTRNITEIRSIREYECSICLEPPSGANKMLNHIPARKGQATDKGHPGMPICKQCVTEVIKNDPRCPVCREDVTREDFVKFKPSR